MLSYIAVVHSLSSLYSIFLMNIYAVDEHLKYFQFLAIYKQRCLENFPTCLWWHIYTVLFYANLGMKLLVKGICVFNFRKCCKTIFIGISSHLPSYQHITRVPVSLNPQQHLLFSTVLRSQPCLVSM